MISAADLLRDLIRCPSVTPDEGGALTLLAAVLKQAGFTVHRPVFDAPGTASVENLYARLGTERPCLVFAGHTDVVPPGDPEAWTHPPFAGDSADGVIFGRGAVDMKGGVAASVAAVLAYLAAEGAPSGSIAFLITGDEEGPAINGTTKLLEWARARGETFDHCILGEPTNPDRLGDMMKIGRRGSLSGTLSVLGTQGHVAYPERAANPIPPLLEAIQALLNEPLDAGTAHFDPSNLEFTSVDVGNPSTNVIPARASARFNIRFNDIWTPDSLKAEVARRLPQAARVAIDWLPCNALAFLTAPNAFTNLVGEAVAAETGLAPRLSTTGGTSDARFIVADCPVVEFGLVGRTMHAVDECVPIADLDSLTRIYRRIIGLYFA